MGKLLAAVAAILLFVGIYTAKVYMQSNTQTSKEMAVEGDESSSFELGQRFPAGKKIDYKQVGLKEKKSSEIKNLSAHSIHQQEKPKKRKRKTKA